MAGGQGSRTRRRAARIIAHLGRAPHTLSEARLWTFGVRPDLSPHNREKVAAAMLAWRS